MAHPPGQSRGPALTSMHLKVKEAGGSGSYLMTWRCNLGKVCRRESIFT